MSLIFRCFVVAFSYIFLTDMNWHLEYMVLANITIALHNFGEKSARNIAKQAQLKRNSHFQFLKLPRWMQLHRNTLSSISQLPLYDQVISTKKLATYFGEIAIGKNPTTKFKVLFDTGSCEFWVPDEACLSDQCDGHNKYTRSSMFFPRFTSSGIPSIMDVEYLSGKLQGYDGFETVYLGDGISIPNTPIGFATAVDIPLLKELSWDGIVGLGFKIGEVTNRGVKPFLDHLVESQILPRKKLKNQFAYYLSETGGALTFGNAVPRFMLNPKDNFSWIPVDPSNGYWTVNVLGIRKWKSNTSTPSNLKPLIHTNKAIPFHDGGKASIVDTGTYLIYAPKDVMYGYLNDLHITSCSDKAKLPVISFFVPMEAQPDSAVAPVIEIPLTPEDYVLQFDGRDGTPECILGIAADEADDEVQLGGWTLGQVFLRSYYTIFDRDKMRIGVVRSHKSLTSENVHKNAVAKEGLLARRKDKNGPIEIA